MGKSALKTKSKGRKNTSKTPVSSIGTELSQSKSGKTIRHSFNEMYNEGHILVEIPQCRRIIFVEKEPYFLSLPKMRFFMPYIKRRDGTFASRFVRWCFVKATNKTILVPPFPNVFENLKVCCPTASGKTLGDMVDAQIKALFASSFNDETWDTLEHYYFDEFFDDDEDETYGIHQYMEKWMKKTKKKPDWVPKKFAKYDGEKSDFTDPDEDGDY